MFLERKIREHSDKINVFETRLWKVSERKKCGTITIEENEKAAKFSLAKSKTYFKTFVIKTLCPSGIDMAV